MSDPKHTPGNVVPLSGKYYGTQVDIGHTTITVWDHTSNSRPSDRELASYGLTLEQWEVADKNTRWDITCDNHYETQEDYEIALLVAAAPRLAAALKEVLPLAEEGYHFREANGISRESHIAALDAARAALREAGVET